MRLEPVDDLELLHLAGAGKKIGQHPVKRQGRQLACLELRHRDVLDEGSLRVGFGVSLVETIDVLDQRMVGAAIALGEQKTARVGAVRRDAADTRRVLPDPSVYCDDLIGMFNHIQSVLGRHVFISKPRAN